MILDINTKRRSQKEILIIDDDVDTRAFLNKILGNAGYEVSEAETVEGGISLIEAKAPHLILLDFKLGEENGFEVMAKLRKIHGFSHIPVILMSANTSKKLVVASVANGASEFMGKPIKAPVLLQRVKKLMQDFELSPVTFEKGVKVEAKFIGDLIRINEMGLILQSSVKFARETSLYIESDYLKSLGASPCETKTAGPAKVANPGIYRNEVHFRGMDEKTAQKIRNIKIT